MSEFESIEDELKFMADCSGDRGDSETSLMFVRYLAHIRKLNTELAELKAGQGEAVAPIEVIGYASPGQVEILRNVPLTGGMKVRGSPDKRYTEPVVLLSAAKSAVFQAVIRCQQKGAFKTCMECGYQDGHDQICQYHESKRTNGSHAVTRSVAEQFLVSYHAEVWSAAEAEDSRIAYDEAGRSLSKAFLARFDDTAPPASADAVSVPVELMRRLAKRVMFRSQEEAHADACEELRALLARQGVKS